MKRLLIALFAATGLALVAGVADARDRVDFYVGGPDFAVNYSNGHYYPPRRVYYTEPAYVYAPPAVVYPRVAHRHYRHLCPRGDRYVPAHYSYRWGHWVRGHCRHW